MIMHSSLRKTTHNFTLFYSTVKAYSFFGRISVRILSDDVYPLNTDTTINMLASIPILLSSDNFNCPLAARLLMLAIAMKMIVVKKSDVLYLVDSVTDVEKKGAI